MKTYEKPIAEIYDFAAERIMDSGQAGGGPSDVQEGSGDLPG